MLWHERASENSATDFDGEIDRTFASALGRSDAICVRCHQKLVHDSKIRKGLRE